MSVQFLLLLAATVAMSLAQTENIQNVFNNVSVPPELKGKLNPKDFESLQNKTAEQIKARCENNGGPEAYGKAVNASTELSRCLGDLVNIPTLQQEIETAKPNGDVEEVFKKYCQKKPQFEGCLKNFTDASKTCFSEKEQRHLVTVYNVSQQLADFICFKEGDRIALFIAEGGQECFQEKQEGLRLCVNNTMGLQENFDINSMSNLTITFDEKQCKQLLDLQTCVVGQLLTCPKPTSGNIVESLFKYIRKSTPCKNFTDNQKGAAATFFVTSVTLVTALVANLLL